MRIVGALTLVAMLLGCSSSDETTPAAATSGAGGSGGAATNGGGGSGGTGTGGTGTGGMGTGGMGTGGVPSGGPVTPGIVASDLYVNCQPGITTDPVHGSFIVDYDNTGGMAEGVAEITSVYVEFSRIVNMMPETLRWAFDVTPIHSGLVPEGDTAQVQHVKLDGSGRGSGMGAPCDWCGDSWRLYVSYQTDGMPVDVNRNLTGVSCVY